MISPIFLAALPALFKHEGIDSDHPNDPGGRTRYGISLRWLRKLGELGDLDGDGNVDVDDIRCVTRERAQELYFNHFWSKHYDQFTVHAIAHKVFDLRVNMGRTQAEKLLQRAVNLCNGHNPSAKLRVDGMVGPVTVGECNRINGDRLLRAFQHEAARYYFTLTENKSRFLPFLRGWLRRAYA